MKRHLVGMMGVAISVIGLLMLGVYSTTAAPEGSPGQGDRAREGSPAQHDMRAERVSDDAKDMKDRQHLMADMSPEAMMRCRMHMNMSVSPSDPGAILALREPLKLTVAQVTQLETLSRETRIEAAALLTAEQKKTFDVLPQAPQTMMQMHEQLLQQTQPTRQTTMQPTSGPAMGSPMGQRMREPQWSCPLMQMMQEDKEATTPRRIGQPTAGVDTDRTVGQ